MFPKYLLAILFLTLVLHSCEKNEELSADPNNLLVGHWLATDFSEEHTTFRRAKSLTENDYGITFKSNGTLVERKNAGWCGTPPISYADFEGNWSQNDSNLSLNVSFWGGMAQLTWEIESVDATTLIVKRVEEKYPID